MIKHLKKLVDSSSFQTFIVIIILLNAAIIGMETYPAVSSKWAPTLAWLDRFCLSIFIIEILLKITSCGKKPQDYFKDGWNIFDFLIVSTAFLPGLGSETTILRLIRLLRVLRLLSALPSLQVMIAALLHSIPRIGQMGILASLLFYIYAVVGQTLFGQHDPQHWGTLHISLLSLFRTLTLEDWTDLMYTNMELYPWAWVYHVSFVLMATFVIFNMLIGIILNSMEEARVNLMAETDGRESEVLLTDIRDRLDRLEHELRHQNQSPGKPEK